MIIPDVFYSQQLHILTRDLELGVLLAVEQEHLHQASGIFFSIYKRML